MLGSLCLATNERFLKRRVIRRKGLHLNISSYLSHQLTIFFSRQTKRRQYLGYE